MSLSEIARSIARADPEPGWHLEAACSDLEGGNEEADRRFFGHGRTSRATEELCEDCPVRNDCILAGLQEPEGRASRGSTRGRWGGLPPRELDDIRVMLQDRGIPVPDLEAYDTYQDGSREYNPDRYDPLGDQLESVAGDEDQVMNVMALYRAFHVEGAP